MNREKVISTHTYTWSICIYVRICMCAFICIYVLFSMHMYVCIFLFICLFEYFRVKSVF